MTITSFALLTIVYLFIHFVADFMLQNDAMAKNKSKSNMALFQHCSVYTMAMFVGGIWMGYVASAVIAIINGVFHFVIDWVTARCTTYYYQTENRHMFFVAIGLDQFIHTSILILSLLYIMRG